MKLAHPNNVMALVSCVALGLAATFAATAAPGSTSGPYALALAGVIAPYSTLGARDKAIVARLFAGDTHIRSERKITVTADTVRCRVSNVAIAERSCELAFGSRMRTVKGPAANDIFATLAAAGVASDGAAGSIFEAVTKLMCTLDPHAIAQNDGSGADCMFETG